MIAIQNILAVTAKSWNIRPPCANQEYFAARQVA